LKQLHQLDPAPNKSLENRREYSGAFPGEIRDTLRLRPGQKMIVIEYDGRIELIPDRDISELRGFLKGIDTHIEREEDRV